MFYWYEQVALGLLYFLLINLFQIYYLEGQDILLYLIKKFKGEK